MQLQRSPFLSGQHNLGGCTHGHLAVRRPVRLAVSAKRAPVAPPESARKAMASKPAKAEAKGYKWNPAQMRWERSDKEGSDIDLRNNLITPKVGLPYLVWPAVHAELTKRGLKSITCEEAEQLVARRGAVLVDVRAPHQFAAEHAAGAVNVPLFRLMQSSGKFSTLKRVASAFMGMRATERNPDFAEEAAARLDKKATLVVMCSRGGTLTVGVEPWAPGRKAYADDPERAFGIESRSLKACYELLEAGYKNVVHLKGGLSQWRYDGRPIETGS